MNYQYKDGMAFQIQCYKHLKNKKIFKPAQVLMNDMATWRVQSLLNGDGIFFIDENKLANDKPNLPYNVFNFL